MESRILDEEAGRSPATPVGLVQLLDLARRRVVLDGGEHLRFEGAILATGSRPRALPGQADLPDVVVLRSVDDSLDLRERIAGGGKRVVVIGAGFIGLEVAATARKLGNEVLVLESATAPLIRGLGAAMGAAIAAVHADHGVDTVGLEHRGALVRRRSDVTACKPVAGVQ